jgi:hypothetical protein
MKTLAVTLKLHLSIPDDWELVKTSDGVEILRMADGRYLDLTFEPLVTDDPEGTWTNDVDNEFLNDLLDMVETEDVGYQLLTN